MRKIIHIDMDAFFAAVEMRDFPEYRGVPLIVGGPPKSRGVVSTCNYEARRYGIHSAMPSFKAYELCPHAVFVRGRYDAYREASTIIHQIFHKYTDQVQSVSIDEAYLDVTDNLGKFPSATAIAVQIRQEIYEQTRLTASAGVSYNKFLAKIGSELNKPNGLKVIVPADAQHILDNLKVEKFHGIGPSTAQKMHSMGIYYGKDMRKFTLLELAKAFGKQGSYYYDICHGVDNRPVNISRVRKSISKEHTFRHDIKDIAVLEGILAEISAKVAKRMQEKNIKGKNVTVKIKYDDFEQITRAKTFRIYIDDEAKIFNAARELLHSGYDTNRKLRLLGVGVNMLLDEEKAWGEQLYFRFYTHKLASGGA